MGTTLFWMGVICIVFPFLIGAFIAAGNPGGDEDDYMIGDEDTDLRDKS